jgi:hypothetical protein
LVRSLVLALLGFLAVACSQEEWMRKIAPPAQQDIARSYIEKLRNRDVADIENAVDASIAGDLQGGTPETMADAIPEYRQRAP